MFFRMWLSCGQTWICLANSSQVQELRRTLLLKWSSVPPVDRCTRTRRSARWAHPILSRNLRCVNRCHSFPTTPQCCFCTCTGSHFYLKTVASKVHFRVILPAASAFCCCLWQSWGDNRSRIQERTRSVSGTGSPGGGKSGLMCPFNTPKDHLLPAERVPHDGPGSPAPAMLWAVNVRSHSKKRRKRTPKGRNRLPPTLTAGVTIQAVSPLPDSQLSLVSWLRERGTNLLMKPGGIPSGGVEGKAEVLWMWKRLNADRAPPDDSYLSVIL